MKTLNFEKLIQSITKREFKVNTKDAELLPDSEYIIFKELPLSKRKIWFAFKTPKNEENLIKSFINQFCKKYREPNPAHYNGKYSTAWADMSDKEREFAYLHHSSNMFSDTLLLEQIKENLNDSGIEDTLCKYGFYETNYGIGIFVLFSGRYELGAIERMVIYLRNKNIPFTNEFSKAKWVFRFVLNINKDIHKEILKSFN